MAVIFVGGLDLFFGNTRRNDLFNIVDRQALLQRKDENQIGDMHAVVFALHRGRHDLQTHIVVNGRSRDKFVFLVAGDEVQILLQQVDDLIHIQSEIRDGIPLRQMIVCNKLIPPLQFMGNQCLVIAHDRMCLLHIFLYYIKLAAKIQEKIAIKDVDLF